MRIACSPVAPNDGARSAVKAKFGGWCFLCRRKYRSGTVIIRHGQRWVHDICPVRRLPRNAHEGEGRRP